MDVISIVPSSINDVLESSDSSYLTLCGNFRLDHTNSQSLWNNIIICVGGTILIVRFAYCVPFDNNGNDYE